MAGLALVAAVTLGRGGTTTGAKGSASASQPSERLVGVGAPVRRRFHRRRSRGVSSGGVTAAASLATTSAKCC
jgi:hypothetical protein